MANVASSLADLDLEPLVPLDLHHPLNFERDLVFDLLPEEALDLLMHPDQEELLLLEPKPDISQQLYSTNKI